MKIDMERYDKSIPPVNIEKIFMTRARFELTTSTNPPGTALSLTYLGALWRNWLSWCLLMTRRSCRSQRRFESCWSQAGTSLILYYIKTIGQAT